MIKFKIRNLEHAVDMCSTFGIILRSGARKRGILGVFTGLGKGAVGLFLRPATGLLDLTSATLTVVQK